MPGDSDKALFLLTAGFPRFDDHFVQGYDPLKEFNEITMQDAAHLAVNINDRSHRDLMRRHAIEHLRAGATLTTSERAWLIYVLSNIEDLPHESKGRPVDGNARAMFRLSLASFVVGDKCSNPAGNVTERLKAAADSLCVSYEKARAAYYEKDFEALCDRLSKHGFSLDLWKEISGIK